MLSDSLSDIVSPSGRTTNEFDIPVPQGGTRMNTIGTKKDTEIKVNTSQAKAELKIHISNITELIDESFNPLKRTLDELKILRKKLEFLKKNPDEKEALKTVEKIISLKKNSIHLMTKLIHEYHSIVPRFDRFKKIVNDEKYTKEEIKEIVDGFSIIGRKLNETTAIFKKNFLMERRTKKLFDEIKEDYRQLGPFYSKIQKSLK